MFPRLLPRWRSNLPTAREVVLTPDQCRAWFGPCSGAVPLHNRPLATTEHQVRRTGGRASGRMLPVGASAGDRDLLPVPVVSGGLPARRARQRKKHTFAEAALCVLGKQSIKPFWELSLATQFRQFSNGNQPALPRFSQGLFNDVV